MKVQLKLLIALLVVVGALIIVGMLPAYFKKYQSPKAIASERQKHPRLTQLRPLARSASLPAESSPKPEPLPPLSPQSLPQSSFAQTQTEFLPAIVEQTGLPDSDVFITVCDLSNNCHNWQGEQTPASAASLIKLPIAIALMQKITDAEIDLDTSILITWENYTEDALNTVEVDREYSLRYLLMQMIGQSSNIATNQLIDYLGRDYINQVLRDRGYEVTFVDSKLVGEVTMPEDFGLEPNRITTNELTDMMQQIYTLEHPGDAILMEALLSSAETGPGYAALEDSQARWIGEKVGQNSYVLGTTLAFSVSKKWYVATVALNYTDDETILQQCISNIVQHIERQGL